MFSIVGAAIHIFNAGGSLRLMVAYIPALIGACLCAIACAGLYRRKAWVRWLFLIPVATATFQAFALLPYLFLSSESIDDPAAKASIAYMVGGMVGPLLSVVVAIAVAIMVFRHLRQEKPSSPIRVA